MYWLLSDLDDVNSLDEFWKQMDDFLEMVEESLSSHLETKEEALAKGTGTSFKDKDPYGTYDVFSYRRTDYRPELEYNYNFAQELLPDVKNIIVERVFTPASVFKMMTLFYCHGYLMPAAFAVDDDMAGGRASKAGNKVRSVEAQRQWASHYIVREYDLLGDRYKAEDALERLVNAIVNGDIDLPDGFDVDWFKKLIKWDDSDGESYWELRNTYRQNPLSMKKARKYIKMRSDDIPPTDLKVPIPPVG